jgi:hypothetical protein
VCLRNIQITTASFMSQGAVDLAHAACADGRGHFIMTKA